MTFSVTHRDVRVFRSSWIFSHKTIFGNTNGSFFKVCSFFFFPSPTQGLSSTAPESRRGKTLPDASLCSPTNSCHSDSFMSNASYPLTQPGQRQRRLNSTSNLRRTRFNTPCFGLLSGTSETSKPQANGIPPTNMLPDTSGAPSSQQQLPDEALNSEEPPVFAISEEEDRQPLVSPEHPEKPLRINGQMFEGPKMPLLSKSHAPSIQPTSLVSLSEDPSALSCSQ